MGDRVERKRETMRKAEVVGDSVAEPVYETKILYDISVL
jgi:hypothetical protein